MRTCSRKLPNRLLSSAKIVKAEKKTGARSQFSTKIGKAGCKSKFICIFPRRNFKTTQKVRRQKTLEYQLFIRFIARNRSRTEQRNRNRPGLIPESITIPKAARSNFKHGIIAVSGAFWMRNGPSPFRRKGARKGANYKRDHRQRISDRRIRAAIVE